MRLTFTDENSEIEIKTRKTKDGYLTAYSNCARIGIQDYMGYELGFADERAKKVFKIYRPESEVFSRDSLSTFAGKPVTDDHPSQFVDSKNWKDLAKGNVGSEVLRDGDKVKVPLVVMDQDLIDKIEEGKHEISMGYESFLKMESGVTDSGEYYDGIQTNIRINHLAIVDKGRAGKECKIDDKRGNKMATKTIMVDGLSVETTDAGEKAILSLQKQLNDAEQHHKKELEEVIQKMSDKDVEIGKLEAKVLDTKKSKLSYREVTNLINERMSIIDNARNFIDEDLRKMSNDDIIKAVVSKHTDQDLANKSPEYILGAYEFLISKDKEFENKSAVSDSFETSKTIKGRQSYLDQLNSCC